MASRVKDVLVKIHSSLKQPAAALNNVAIYLGPVVTGSTRDAIFIGYDGDPEGEYLSATASQQWAGLGAKRRDESIGIVCAVIVTTGSTDPTESWTRAYEILAAVEDTLRANVSQDFPSPTVIEITETQLFTEQVQTGLQIRLPFTVSVPRTRT